MSNLRDEIYLMLGEYLFPSASRNSLTDKIEDLVSKKIEENSARYKDLYSTGYNAGYEYSYYAGYHADNEDYP